MSTTSTQTDDLDLLLSDFFKSQLKQPWPKAPLPAAAASEPSELVTARTMDAPRNTPAVPAPPRSNTARARFTLAASVALVLGTGWFLTSGFAPATRTNGTGPATNGPGLLQNGDAKGMPGGALDEMEKNKINNPPKPDTSGKGGIKLDKIGDDE